MKIFLRSLTVTFAALLTGGAAEVAAQIPGVDAAGTGWTDALLPILTSPIASALLIMIGLGGIMYAIKTGHMGMFAAAGLASIVLFFAVQYTADLATAVEVILFLAGIAFILAEVFLIPGFGVVGILGAVMVLASLFLALVGDFSLLSYSSVTIPLYTLAGSFVGVIVMMALMIRYLPTSSTFTRFVLQDEQTPMSSLVPRSITELVDVVGEAVTTLRPAGVALLRGERHDVITEGDFIPAGEPVRVVRVEGRKIIVRRGTGNLPDETTRSADARLV